MPSALLSSRLLPREKRSLGGSRTTFLSILQKTKPACLLLWSETVIGENISSLKQEQRSPGMQLFSYINTTNKPLQSKAFTKLSNDFLLAFSECKNNLRHQRLKSLQVIQDQHSRAFTWPSCSVAWHSPEHTDELRGHELWAEFLHLCHIAKEAQHIAMQLLFLWELLTKSETGLYNSRSTVILRTRDPG